MTPHAQLLLECARRRPEAGAIKRLAHSAIDWPAFLCMAGNHDLQSLCYWRLQQHCSSAVPSHIFDALRRHFRHNTDRNLFLTGELFRILDALQRGGVPAAAFKGPVFSWSIYETPAAREFTDLDLLVHRKDIVRAKDLLRELGYRSESPMPGGAELQFFKYGGQLVLIREAPAVTVDLHWDLAPRSMGLALAADALWPQLILVPVAGRPVLSFDPNDQLMLSALHGGKHGWTTLAWLADIDAMVETQTLDWDRVLADAQTRRLTRALFLALQLASGLLQTAVPHPIMQKVRADSAATALAAEARSFLLNGPGGKPWLPRRLVYQVRITEGRLRQLQQIWRKITEPNIADSEPLKLRPRLFWLYYAARPCRLAVKYAAMLVTRLWGQPRRS
jgi:hypothetical protein